MARQFKKPSSGYEVLILQIDTV